MRERYEALDWLRGLMAISIMLYHYSLWTFGEFDSSTIIGRLGLYGVSAFYVISGLSMAIVYNNKMNSLKDAGKFFIKRIFRIFPLMWLVTALVVIQCFFLKQNLPTVKSLILNLTVSFGFIDPSDYIATGAWSIGNEMVFYLLFPLLIYFFNKGFLVSILITFLAILIEGFFAFYLLNPSISLANQWDFYINPFNQLYLFVCGIFIFYLASKIKVDIKTWLIYVFILFCAFLFIIFPAKGNQITIASGLNRIVLSLICIAIVWAFFRLKNIKLGWISNLFNNIGLATYSIYLLHPFVYHFINFPFKKFGYGSSIYVMITSFAITIILGIIVYKRFELQFMSLGKRIASKL